MRKPERKSHCEYLQVDGSLVLTFTVKQQNVPLCWINLAEDIDMW